MRSALLNSFIGIGICLGAITLFRMLLPEGMHYSELPIEAKVVTLAGMLGFALLVLGVLKLTEIVALAFDRTKGSYSRNAWSEKVLTIIAMLVLGGGTCLYYWHWLEGVSGT